jgi:alkanesulfonate monooxygenase SsuD/methylene tetrahydromethanopterin reductase-like flavin-dependent oxidoreductase (luciferase family)
MVLRVMKRRRLRQKLRYGLYVPCFGKSAEPTVMSKMAVDAEKFGWDGFFLWDHVVEWDRRVPLYDSFTSLAAIAAKTTDIRIGTTVTPLPSRKPWSVARQTVTLDHLSNGRLTLGVGLGTKESCDYDRFAEDADNKLLAEKLDESLDIITGLWTGRSFSYAGKHYRIGSSIFIPRPRQRPRIPIWVAGFWPHKAPMRRAAKWDGVIPLLDPGRLMKPEDLSKIVEFVRSIRSSNESFDVVNISWTTGVNRKRDSEKVRSFAEAGMTWWLESLYTMRDSPVAMRKRIRLGPPRID